jgi:hypothetical protein
MAEVSTFWVGIGHEIVSGTTNTDLVDSLVDTNLGSNVHNGDTVIRWLIEWALFTALVDNSSGVEVQPTPWIAGVFFTPNPNPLGAEIDTIDLIGAEVGDAIYTERTKWTPSRWTDGTLHATQWHAGSVGVIDIHAKRTFYDHSTDRISFGVQSLHSEFTSSVVDFTVGGWMRLKCLIER